MSIREEDPTELDGAEDGWEDWVEDDDAEQVQAKSLLSDAVFASVGEAIAHDAATFGFNLEAAAKSLGNGDLSLIMLVNLIRRRVKDLGGQAVDASFVAKIEAEIASKTFLDDEAFMLPVLQDDVFLYLLQDALGVSCGDDDDDEDEDEAGGKRKGSAAGAAAAVEAGEAAENMRAEMNKYKAIVTALTAEPSDRKEGTDDGYYFDSYSHLSIHETMLRDAPRTGAYARAISSPDFMRGKVVLDVGCGTGILCLLAARAGAKKVIGIDFSSMIEKSRQVVEQNGYSDVITLIRGRVEEVRLPVDEVDVIVSEWMGYGLYYENMLSSVLHARKEYLAEGGVVMPSHALLFLEAMTATGEHDRVNWWRDVYGFDMTPCSRLLTQEAQVQSVDPDLVVSDRALVHTLDMALAEDESLDFVVPFSLTVTTPGPVRALALSFDVEFRLAAAPGSGETTVLSTAVQSPETHWKQTVLWLQPEFVEEWASGDVISGTLEYHRREANARDYDISVTWTSSAASGAEERTQLFILGS